MMKYVVFILGLVVFFSMWFLAEYIAQSPW